MLRIRFEANLDDPRPVNWPIAFPYWITGYGENYATVVTYCDDRSYVHLNWPEARNLDETEVELIEFTDRFPKPDWYGEPPV
jgi:hypothetical protein